MNPRCCERVCVASTHAGCWFRRRVARPVTSCVHVGSETSASAAPVARSDGEHGQLRCDECVVNGGGCHRRERAVGWSSQLRRAGLRSATTSPPDRGVVSHRGSGVVVLTSVPDRACGTERGRVDPDRTSVLLAYSRSPRRVVVVYLARPSAQFVLGIGSDLLALSGGLLNPSSTSHRDTRRIDGFLCIGRATGTFGTAGSWVGWHGAVVRSIWTGHRTVAEGPIGATVCDRERRALHAEQQAGGAGSHGAKTHALASLRRLVLYLCSIENLFDRNGPVGMRRLRCGGFRPLYMHLRRLSGDRPYPWCLGDAGVFADYES